MRMERFEDVVSSEKPLSEELQQRVNKSGKIFPEIKRARGKIQHLTAVLRAIRNLDQGVTEERDSNKLIKEACNILVANRGYHYAWIVVLDESKRMVMTAEAGLGTDFLPIVERLKRGELTDCGQRAMRQSDVVVTKEPASQCADCYLAGRDNGMGAMTVRLNYGEKANGLLCVSVPIDFTSDEQELALFKGVGEDIAFTLHHIEVEQERQQAQDALRKARDQLERLVQIRTARLVITNELLKEEVEDRHLAEVALRNSEEKYSTLVNNSLTGIYINEGEKILFVNKRFAKIYGYAPEELLGMEARRLVHPDDRPLTDQMRARRLRGEDVPSEYLARGLTKDGKTIWIVRRNTLIEYKGRRAILGNIVDITKRKQAEKALERSRTSLRRLSSRLIQVQEKERQRLSRELHDSIGQSLSAIKFALENKLSLMRDGPAAAKGELLESIIPMVQQASEEVRRIHTDLRPSMLDDLGIIATISWFCREFEKLYSGVRVEKKANIRDEEVPEPLKIVIFRVLQEALNNVSKYSNAGLVRVSLMGTGNRIELVVEDNGQGFDVKNVYGVQESSGGFGLTSMRERTELSEGSFTVESTPGAGTTVRASWPYNEKKPTSQ